jgi:hypothetical protein
MDPRLRGGRARAQTEEEVAPQLMKQVKRPAPEDPPAAMSTDGKGACREAMLQVWGKVPQQSGQARPATLPQAGKAWRSLQVSKKREGGKLVRVTPQGISADREEGKSV